MEEKLREFIAKKTNYLLSLNTKDNLIMGQLLGLKCVIEFMNELEKEKENVKKKR